MKNTFKFIAIIAVIGFLAFACKDDANSTDNFKMVLVPGGSFKMGNPDPSIAYDNEHPVHTVTLTGFYMGNYEVTQAQYKAVMENNPSNFRGNNLPVERVTWYDAVEFCNKLSEREELQPVYTITGRSPKEGYPITSATVTANWNNDGYRLPTEAEWEYAAKGGGDGSPGNHTYSGSNNVGEVAWYSGNSGSTTHAVGTKGPNGLGIYDMSGNVWEWCWDWYGSYSSEVKTDPTGPSSGSNRVRRGGSWFDSAVYVRSADRALNGSGTRGSIIGFRLVRKE